MGFSVQELSLLEINTAVYLLRCKQLGFSVQELSLLEEGQVYDLLAESGNDNEEYDEIATQEDFDNW